ncbi:MAG: hypothetical protein KGN38_00670 [Actinomycetales bacterium]|nr:hypothetical protein [Actinomycetales bacterium]
MTTPDMMRDVIREVVRDVIREVIAEEMAAVAATQVVAPKLPAPKPSPSVAPQANGDVVIARGALTERHVRSAGDAKAITIGSKVVITPLARERARTMGIEIIRVSVEG